MKSMLLGLLGGLLLAVSAIAEEKPASSWFVSLDHNGDGGISLTELQAIRYERFRVIDLNQDQELSAGEVKNSPVWVQRFLRMDQNADNRVTRAEFDDAGRSRFSVIDIDGNGFISAHEALNFQRKVRKYSPTPQKAG